jgi:hypothetical protein
MKTSVIAAIALALGLPMIASAQDTEDCVPGKPEPVFSVPPGSDIESVAVARTGEVFTIELYSGTVYRIATDGQAKVIATLFPAGKYPSLQAAGVLLGDDTSIYVLANTWDPA